MQPNSSKKILAILTMMSSIILSSGTILFFSLLYCSLICDSSRDTLDPLLEIVRESLDPDEKIDEEEERW